MDNFEAINKAAAAVGTGVLEFDCDGPTIAPVRYGHLLYSVYLGEYNRGSKTWKVSPSQTRIQLISAVSVKKANALIEIEDRTLYTGNGLRFDVDLIDRDPPRVCNRCLIWFPALPWETLDRYVPQIQELLRKQALAKFARRRKQKARPVVEREVSSATVETPAPAPAPAPAPKRDLPTCHYCKETIATDIYYESGLGKCSHLDCKQKCRVCKKLIDLSDISVKDVLGYRHYRCYPEPKDEEPDLRLPAEIPPERVLGTDSNGRNIYSNGFRRPDGVWQCPAFYSPNGPSREILVPSMRGFFMLKPSSDGCYQRRSTRLRYL